MLINIIQQSAMFSLAFATGIIFLRRLNLVYKLILLLLFINIVNYSASHFVLLYQTTHHIPKNNIWLFNIYSLVECLMLVLIGQKYLNKHPAGRIAIWSFGVVIIVFTVEIVQRGISTFTNYSACIQALLIMYIYLVVFYQRFMSGDNSRAALADKSFCLGTLLYFACMVPYMSLLNYLQSKDSALNATLFASIVLVLENIRYLLTAVAFYLYGTTRPIVLKPSHE